MSEVRKFAEQTHRDEAKRNRDDHFSEVEKIKIVVWSFDERSESNFLSVCKDLCEILKVQYLYGPVAQLVRAPPCHGGGHGFESRLGRL